MRELEGDRENGSSVFGFIRALQIHSKEKIGNKARLATKMSQNSYLCVTRTFQQFTKQIFGKHCIHGSHGGYGGTNTAQALSLPPFLIRETGNA